MGTLAYASLMKAMRTGEVSAVTPFRYSRLLFGVGLGVVMFGEQSGSDHVDRQRADRGLGAVYSVARATA